VRISEKKRQDKFESRVWLDIFLAMMPVIFSKYGILPQGRSFGLATLDEKRLYRDMDTDEKPLPITQLGDSISLSLEQDEKLPFPVDSNNIANTHRKALVKNSAIENPLENTKSALT
jgi:hypothetical protein